MKITIRFGAFRIYFSNSESLLYIERLGANNFFTERGHE